MHTATAGPHWQGVSTRVPSGTGRPGEAPLSDTSKHHLVKTESTLDIILLSVMRRVKSILIQSHGGYEHPFVLGALTDFKSAPPSVMGHITKQDRVGVGWGNWREQHAQGGQRRRGRDLSTYKDTYV